MPGPGNPSLQVAGQGEGESKPEISPAAIRSQLARILGSATFRSSDRLSRFLEFAVEQTLGGHSGQLKEYVVGCEVFSRKQSFDPRMDPIVRVEAGRLRLRIKEYYETEGQRDEVAIELPKGSYVPVFRRVDSAHATVPAAAAGPAAKPRGQDAAVHMEQPTTRIVVLPFADHSPRKDQEWFCDGMTEELVSALTKVPQLCVVAGASAFRLKGKAGNPREIGEQLRVGTVVEGSVRKSGDNVRITVQLIDVAANQYLWSETYDREMTDIFAVQEDISRAIVDALKIRLSPLESGGDLVSRPTKNLKAYNLYLKGRYYWNTRTEEGLRRKGSSLSSTRLRRTLATRSRLAAWPTPLPSSATTARPLPPRCAPRRRRPPHAPSNWTTTSPKPIQLWGTSGPLMIGTGPAPNGNTRPPWGSIPATPRRTIGMPSPSSPRSRGWMRRWLRSCGRRSSIPCP